MGLIHSGDLCDIVFYERAERNWACNEQVAAAHELIAYWRYRDDILIVYRDVEMFAKWIAEFKRRAGYFRIQCEKIATSTIEYLDLTLFRDGPRLLAKPAFKREKLSRPLGATSGHPMAVHLSWPIGMIRGYGRLSSRHSDAVEAKNTLIARFNKFFTPRTLIDILERTDPFIRTCSDPLLPHSEARRRSKGPTLWLVLPYHPSVVLLMQREISAFNREADLQFLYSSCSDGAQCPKVRLSWKRGNRNVASILTRRHSMENGLGDGG